MDAGCGTGRLTARLLEKMSDGKIVGVDLSENMLRVAKRILEPKFGEKDLLSTLTVLNFHSREISTESSALRCSTGLPITAVSSAASIRA